MKAIASSIRETLREQGGGIPNAVDGSPASQWMILDYVDVIVHIFHTAKREFYGLEDLWSDAPTIPFEDPTPAAIGESPSPS